MADASSLASWVSEVATPATQRSWSLTHGSPCTANSTFASDSAIGYEDGLEIVAGNADEWLYPQSFKDSGADSMIMYGRHGPPNLAEGADSMINWGQK